MNRIAVALIILVGVTVVSCDYDLGFGDKPTLEFVDIQPRTVVEFVDSIVITVSFRDGDGDLGTDDNANRNLFVVDNRPFASDITLDFSLPNLTPDTKNPAIQGNMTIVIPPTAIEPGSGLADQFTNFDVYILDRNDNESNRVTTDSILVVRE